MKKIVALFLAVMMIVELSACSNKTDKGSKKADKGVAKTFETEVVKLDGIFVDTSHSESNGKPLKMVYLFLSFKASDKNFEISSISFGNDIKIGENTYSPEIYYGSCKFMPNYHYANTIKEVFVGEELKIAFTYKVAEGDLETEKEVSTRGLKFTTEDLVRCASVKEIAQKVDPTGYEEALALRKTADKATRNKVRKAVNGYYWEFYVYVGTSLQKNEIEFYAPNKFEIKALSLKNKGTYTVHEGYIFLHYKTTDSVVEVPYEFKDGQIELYLSDAFSLY